jgi:hypothetical protein
MMHNQTAVGLLTEATRDAAMQIAKDRGIYQPGHVSDEFVDKFIQAVKSSLLDNLDQVMSEWKEATEAHLNDAWLRELMKTQALQIANIAVNKL